MVDIKFKRGTNTNLVALNPILSLGEPIYNTTTKVVKIGDGVTPYNELVGFVLEAPDGDGTYLRSNLEWTEFEVDGVANKTGFPNRVDSTIYLTGSEFTIEPTITNYSIFINGEEIVLNTAQTVNIPNNRQGHFVFFNSSGVLSLSTTPWSIVNKNTTPVAFIFRESASIFTLTDERHGSERNLVWHDWAHNNIGALFNKGLAANFTNTTFSIGQGVIYDEDIRFDTVTPRTVCSHWRRDGVNPTMVLTRGNITPYITIGGILQYDNEGVLTNVSNNNFMSCFIFASNDINEPIYSLIGQKNYNTLNLAVSDPEFPEVRIGVAEWVLIYRVIYKRAGANVTVEEVQDLRASSLSNPISTNLITTSTISIVDGGEEL